jgi:polysaccharide export outer membrane protein
MQLFAMAGDINLDTNSGDVLIFRTIDGTRSAAKFDYDDIKAGKAEDPEVEPGDVVVVNTSDVKVAFSNIIRAMPLATTAAVLSGL